MVKSAEGAGPPPMALMAAIGKLGEEAVQAGAMVQMGGLLPSAMGARVRLTAGKLVVTDGPFAETKELIGGFAVYDVKSKQEAIEWASRFMQLHKTTGPVGRVNPRFGRSSTPRNQCKENHEKQNSEK